MAGGLFRRRRGPRDPFADVERPAAPPPEEWPEDEPIEIRAGSRPVDLDRVTDDWDDEWGRARLPPPEHPAAMDIAPAQVDAWLEDQARDLDDVTRDNTARWGGDETLLRTARGSTWDDEPAAAEPTRTVPRRQR